MFVVSFNFKWGISKAFIWYLMVYFSAMEIIYALNIFKLSKLIHMLGGSDSASST